MDSRENKKPSHIQFWKFLNKGSSKHSFWSWKREKAEQNIGKSAQDAANNAKLAATAALPGVTALGVALLGDTGGIISFAPLGIPVIIGGIVIDTVKAPIALTVATEEAVRAGITKLISLIFEKPPADMQMDRIFQSFLIRMKETATVLVALGLEDKNVLDNKLKSGDIEDLVGLTLLHTAFASRNCNTGLVLANKKILERQDCPPEGLQLFDKITDVKKAIQEALKSAMPANAKFANDEERELEESRVICEWIKDIYAGKVLTAHDKPSASQAELTIINTLINKIADLKQDGMNALPKSADYVASHINRRFR